MARSFSVKFNVYIEAHNHLGEKVRCPVDSSMNHRELERCASIFGIELNNPYSKKLRQIPIPENRITDIRQMLGIVLGEYKHGQLFCYQRNHSFSQKSY
jgi:hypothetical protein